MSGTYFDAPYHPSLYTSAYSTSHLHLHFLMFNVSYNLGRNTCNHDIDGKLLVTTAPAPTTTLSPNVTPGHIVALALIHTLFPMVMGKASSSPLMRNCACKGCVAAVYANVWTQQTIVTDCNQVAIQNGTSVIGIKVVSHYGDYNHNRHERVIPRVAVSTR